MNQTPQAQNQQSPLTRAQRNMILAEKCVAEVAEANSSKTKSIYKGLCKNFPVMVRTCGLCQAIAFSAAKAQDKNKDRAEAHHFLLEHLGELLNKENTPLKATWEAIREADTTEYMLLTRQTLDAWIYFKRFAESILTGVEAEEEE